MRVIYEKPVAATEEYEIDEDMLEDHNSTTDFSSDDSDTEDEEEGGQQVGALSLSRRE